MQKKKMDFYIKVWIPYLKPLSDKLRHCCENPIFINPVRRKAAGLPQNYSIKKQSDIMLRSPTDRPYCWSNR